MIPNREFQTIFNNLINEGDELVEENVIPFFEDYRKNANPFKCRTLEQLVNVYMNELTPYQLEHGRLIMNDV